MLIQASLIKANNSMGYKKGKEDPGVLERPVEKGERVNGDGEKRLRDGSKGEYNQNLLSNCLQLSMIHGENES